MRQKLLDILKTKPSMVNLGRVLKARNTELFDWVMNNPVKYPKEASFNERVYGIENNLEEIPQNEDGGNRKFLNYFEGYGELYPLEPTLENIIKLKDKASTNTSGFKTEYKQLYDAVFQFTSNFREDAKFTERLYCLVNDIDQQDFKFDCYKRGYTTIPYISKQEKELEKQALEAEFLKLANRLNSDDLKFGKKLYSYKKKHIENHKDLYDLDESLNGIDYIFEPVLEIRSPMVKKNYIEKVLRMDVKEYDKLYPGVRGRCQSSIEKIIVIQNTPDENGITPHQKSVDNTKIKLSEIGDDGLTGYERKGIKTKNTHMSNLDENGQNGYHRIAGKRIAKNESKKDPKEEKFKRIYKNLVRYLSADWKNKVPSHIKLGKAGTEGAYQLDHKFSVMDGYKINLSPYILSDIRNMDILTWEDNKKKWHSSSITLEELLDLVNYSKEQADIESKITREVIMENLDKKLSSGLLSTLIRKRIHETNL